MVLVRKNPQPKNFVRDISCLWDCVVVGHTEQDDKAMADSTDGMTFNLYTSC